MLDQQQACCSWSLPKNNSSAPFYAATERNVAYDDLVRPLLGEMEQRLSKGAPTGLDQICDIHYIKLEVD